MAENTRISSLFKDLIIILEDSPFPYLYEIFSGQKVSLQGHNTSPFGHKYFTWYISYAWLASKDMKNFP